MKKVTDDPILQKRVTYRDEKYLDVTERANKVTEFLCAALGLKTPKEATEQPLFWDLVAFSTEWLNMFAFVMQDDDPELFILAQAWNSKIHSMHYALRDDEASLGPKRDEHLAIWDERIGEF